MGVIRLLQVFVLLLLLPIHLLTQEVLTGLQFNEMKRNHPSHEVNLRVDSDHHEVTLPFFDDFSGNGIYPDPQLWLDQDVFINMDFPVRPPNIGAATFDVLDQTGKIYAYATSTPFIADYLTSRPIRLDSLFSPIARPLQLSDSIYLSFYYQPQGRGDKPEPHDSLVLQFGYPTGEMVFDYVDSVTVLADIYLENNNLEFLAVGDTLYAPGDCNPDLYLINTQVLYAGDWVTIPCDTVMKPEITWRSVWSAEGMSLEDFVETTGKYFQQVLIPIRDPVYLTDLFQFRFYNYASIAEQTYPNKRSNVDQWNVDFIYLNYNRHLHDTTYNKLSFSGRPPSFLRRYEAMPYRQYRADPSNANRPELELLITNMGGFERNTKYRYQVKQLEGTYAFGYDGGSCNLPPVGSFGFQNCTSGCGAAHACPPVNQLFSLDFDRDTTSYLITHFISDSTGSTILVDSMTYRQGFYNYFAYDDGTPELGYGLVPARAMLAYKFRLTTPDTLQGVQMYFNRTLNNANDRFFDIVVWNERNEKPGDEIYRKTKQRPQWNDQLYGFHYYRFDEPLIVSGNFYIGLQQEEGGGLNIGFDAVNNSSENLFFDSGDGWTQSDYEGSLMIRPVVGADYFIGLDENTMEPDSEPALTVFPNPAQNTVTLSISGANNWHPESVMMFDLTGRLLLHEKYHNTIDISGLPPGLMIIKVVGQHANPLISRIIKTN